MTEKSAIQYSEQREYSLLEDVLRAPLLDFPSILALVASSLAIALAMYHIFVAGFGTPESLAFRLTHLGTMLLLAFLIKPLFRSSLREPVWQPGSSGNAKRSLGFAVDIALICLVLAVQIYMLTDIDDFQARQGSPDPSDIVYGWIMIGLVMEATRRAVGWTMVIITAFFIVQTLFADHFIGMFYGPPVPMDAFIDSQFIQTIGIFGIPILVASTYIVLFIIFGAILIRSGAGKFFIDLAVALTGHRQGGPAKAAVVASAMMGTVSGSATANVVTTGSFTIPMMKKLGYRPRFAAAVEACSSSGGQITPPIMGAAAFIIAEFLRVPYINVVIAAIIPTFLYFSTMYFMVHLEADKFAIARLPKSQLPRFGEVLREGWHLMLALAVLIVFLIMGHTVTLAAFWAIIALFFLSFVSASTRMSPVDLLSALEMGVRSCMPVTVACACAGIIIGCTFTSGLGLKFTNSVIDMSHGYLLALLILTALASIVLGMGITTTAVYITVAALIVPALIKIGVNPMAAHMFAFYFGVVSSITPPVALAAFAAAAIAKTSPLITAVESARVGIAKYIVPFIFVYNPSLLFEGPVWLTVYSVAIAFAGVWLLSSALEGWMKGRLGPGMRFVSALGALGLLYPCTVDPFGISGFIINSAGAAIGVGLWMARHRPAIAPAASDEART